MTLPRPPRVGRLVAGIAAGLALGTGATLVLTSGPGAALTGDAHATAAVALRPSAHLDGGARTAAAPATSTIVSDLRSSIDAALRGSTAGSIGVDVRVAGLGLVEARNATTALPPASTEKLFTAATVLNRIGTDARLRTRFRLYGHRYNHWLAGKLVIVGGGDPTLTSDKLRRVAAAIRRTGITMISHGIVVDATRYDRVHTAPGWKPTFVPEETGPLSAVVVDWNTYSSTAVSYPAIAAGRLMRHDLAAAGVRVNGDVTAAKNPSGNLVYTYTAVSQPVGTVVRDMLENSINMYAEQFLKELPARAGQTGSTAGGVALVRSQGESLGVPVTTAVADGSGLSSFDRQTPATEVAWLGSVLTSPIGSQFRHSLAVACRSGTLRYRMCGTAAAGRVWAKTGTLDGVRCLAGYTWTRSGRRVTFSFLLSYATRGPSATAAIDRAVEVLAGFNG